VRELVLPEIAVPGDFSSAAPFIAAATILQGSSLTLRDISINPTRTGMLAVLERMGARVGLFRRRLAAGEPVADIEVRPAELVATDIEAEIVPTLIDELPLMVLPGQLRPWHDHDPGSGRAAGQGVRPDRHRGRAAEHLRRPRDGAAGRLRGAGRPAPAARRAGRRRRRPPDRDAGGDRRRLLAGRASPWRAPMRSASASPTLPTGWPRWWHRPMVITIDGPAGAGKSTIARAVAERLGLRYVDTGAMYRELTAAALAAGADLDDGAALAALADTPPPPGSDLRAEAISRNVSAVSRHPQVRAAMRGRQRAQAVDAVLEGRDTGSVVCPDADLKIYLVASAGVRAARRAAELDMPGRRGGAVDRPARRA
jgi:hypothetical protein